MSKCRRVCARAGDSHHPLKNMAPLWGHFFERLVSLETRRRTQVGYPRARRTNPRRQRAIASVGFDLQMFQALRMELFRRWFRDSPQPFQIIHSETALIQGHRWATPVQKEAST